jgi:hypothetical protein
LKEIPLISPAQVEGVRRFPEALPTPSADRGELLSAVTT